MSIVIPLNSKTNKDYLKKLLDSIPKSQEVICVYDSKECERSIYELISSYSNCRYYGKESSGRADTLNIGIAESSDDIIYILTENIISLKDEIFNIEFEDYVAFKNVSSIDIIIIKKHILSKIPYWCEQYYYPYELSKFRNTLIDYNLEGKTLSLSSNYAECIESEENIESKTRLNKILSNRVSEYKARLTCIIPFKNEGFEVEKTINSIYATTDSIDIIAINDASDDNYDYSNLQIIFPRIKYIENKKSIGHGNIDLGVANSETEFCILIDAHMRFYQQSWENRVIEVLEEHPKSIVYGTTSIIEKNDNGTYVNEDGKKKPVRTIGAGVIVDPKDDSFFKHFWAYTSAFEDAKENVHKTSNVLGACYAFSRKWYWNIGGTYGLVQYGLSEACLAVKTWMMGGECYRIQDFIVGHVYRKKFPYKIIRFSAELNRRFLLEMFSPINKEEYINKLKNKITAYGDFEKNWNELSFRLDIHIKHFQEKFIMTFEDFVDNINKKMS